VTDDQRAQEFDADVRKAEKSSLVVYANSISKTEDDGSGNDVEREIHFMNGYRL
jgi:antirestriction protein ArdC